MGQVIREFWTTILSNTALKPMLQNNYMWNSISKQHQAAFSMKVKMPIIDETYKCAFSREPLVMKSHLHGNQLSGGKRSSVWKWLGRVIYKI